MENEELLNVDETSTNDSNIVYCRDCGEAINLSTDEYIIVDDCYICGNCKERNYVQCYECGEWFEDGDTVWCDDNCQRYCIGCAESFLSCCDRCGTYHLNENMEYVMTRYRDDENWCNECRDNHTFYCEGYQHLYSDDYEYYEVDGYTYSQEYCENNFNYCDECDSFYSGRRCENCYSTNYENDSEFDCRADQDNNDYVDCYNFYTTHSYNYKPRCTFLDFTKERKMFNEYNRDTCYIGFELETNYGENSKRDSSFLRPLYEKIGNIDEKYLYAKRDGSINGPEFVSHPLTYRAINNLPLRKMFRMCINNGMTYIITNNVDCTSIFQEIILEEMKKKEIK